MQVARMRRQDILDCAIHVVQQKTGTELFIPIHAARHAAMKAAPSNGVSLIGDIAGRPISSRGLTKLMKRAAQAAGLLPRCLAARTA
jgi:hypothetical protein